MNKTPTKTRSNHILPLFGCTVVQIRMACVRIIFYVVVVFSFLLFEAITFTCLIFHVIYEKPCAIVDYALAETKPVHRVKANIKFI